MWTNGLFIPTDGISRLLLILGNSLSMRFPRHRVPSARGSLGEGSLGMGFLSRRFPCQEDPLAVGSLDPRFPYHEIPTAGDLIWASRGNFMLRKSSLYGNFWIMEVSNEAIFYRGNFLLREFSRKEIFYLYNSFTNVIFVTGILLRNSLQVQRSVINRS